MQAEAFNPRVMPCSFELEDQFYSTGHQCVAGVDEAGRGPLAGPVVAAAVILPRAAGIQSLPRLDDSKKLTRRARELAFTAISSHPEVQYSVAWSEPPEIDRINILRATHEAMRRAVCGLGMIPDHVLIDGLPVHPFPFPQTAVVKGDTISFSIAAASIIAKVTRDRIMAGYAAEFPNYGFEQHQGYATALHLAKIREHGPCRIHRRSFAPVAQAVLAF